MFCAFIKKNLRILVFFFFNSPPYAFSPPSFLPTSLTKYVKCISANTDDGMSRSVLFASWIFCPSSGVLVLIKANPPPFPCFIERFGLRPVGAGQAEQASTLTCGHRGGKGTSISTLTWLYRRLRQYKLCGRHCS